MTVFFSCGAPVQALFRGINLEAEPRGLKVFIVFQHVDPEWNPTSLCSVLLWRSVATSLSRL